MSAQAPAIPPTATGSSSDRNYAGQVIAITVFSTIRPLRMQLKLPVVGDVVLPIPGRLFLPILFAVTAARPKLTETLRELSFIHFARWSLIRRLPYNGPPQRKRRFRYAHMYFESNFNGGWEEYIDAFSHILTDGMTAFWGSSFGFPKPLPTAPFKTYIQRNETEASHYYCAYPEATTTMVLRALELDGRLAPLRGRAAQMDPEAFAAAYERLLTDVQGCL
ncbi:MAG: hypothetical protein Q8O56_09840 [Solirubrobacteraceae bacterium]|nr:hypothetical protein [Solirubrobacteraceae bacterium]